MTRFVLLSDTHTNHDRMDVPDGDVLVHAGDITQDGELDELVLFAEFLRGLPHTKKIVIAGNHDFCFEDDRRHRAREILGDVCVYLQDAAVEVAGFRVWGAPWQPRFMDWAFNVDRGPKLADKWAMIPEGIDIVVTHGPPWGLGDLVHTGQRVGCRALRRRLEELSPRLHVCGHIHEDSGVRELGSTLCVNAAAYDTETAIVVDL